MCCEKNKRIFNVVYTILSLAILLFGSTVKYWCPKSIILLSYDSLLNVFKSCTIKYLLNVNAHVSLPQTHPVYTQMYYLCESTNKFSF